MKYWVHRALIGICFWTLFAIETGYAQSPFLELLPGSERMIYDENSGITRLLGGASFRYQNSRMYCDSAHYHEQKQEVRAYGKVHINRSDTLNLFCDSMYYQGRNKLAKLWGHVRVRDREYKLITDSLDYDAAAGRAIYRNGGTVSSLTKPEVLKSRIGYFYPKSKNLFFKGDVHLNSNELEVRTDTLRYHYFSRTAFFYGPTNIQNGKKQLECHQGWYQVEDEEGVAQGDAKIRDGSRLVQGDSLYFSQKKGMTIGKGNVSYADSTEKLSFSGDHFQRDEKQGIAWLTGRALAMFRMKSEDTLFVHGDTLYARSDSLDHLRELDAFFGVKFFHKDFQGKCDSLHYDSEGDEVHFYRDPVLWADQMQLKGERMWMTLKDSSVHRVDVREHATAISEVDSVGYYNQIAGREMWAYFQESKLKYVEVQGNAQSVYFPEETKETDSTVTIERKGMTRIYSASLKVYLDSGEVVGVTYLDKPDAVAYPLSKINKEEQYVSHFSWLPILRPRNKEAILEN